MISVDRLITVVYPNRLKILKTRWFQVGITFAILIYSMLICILLPLNTTLREVTTGNQTVRTCRAPTKILTDISYTVMVKILVTAIFFEPL